MKRLPRFRRYIEPFLLKDITVPVRLKLSKRKCNPRRNGMKSFFHSQLLEGNNEGVW